MYNTISNNHFNDMIECVLKQVHPDMEIDTKAREKLNSLCTNIATYILIKGKEIVLDEGGNKHEDFFINRMSTVLFENESIDILHEEKVSFKDIQSKTFNNDNNKLVINVGILQESIGEVLTNELAKHAICEGTKAVIKFNSGLNNSMSIDKFDLKCGLICEIFPLLILLDKMFPDIQLSLSVVIYLGAVLEYMCAELLELGGNSCRDALRGARSAREEDSDYDEEDEEEEHLNYYHLETAIENDEELKSTFAKICNSDINKVVSNPNPIPDVEVPVVCYSWDIFDTTTYSIIDINIDNVIAISISCSINVISMFQKNNLDYSDALSGICDTMLKNLSLTLRSCRLNGKDDVFTRIAYDYKPLIPDTPIWNNIVELKGIIFNNLNELINDKNSDKRKLACNEISLLFALAVLGNDLSGLLDIVTLLYHNQDFLKLNDSVIIFFQYLSPIDEEYSNFSSESTCCSQINLIMGSIRLTSDSYYPILSNNDVEKLLFFIELFDNINKFSCDLCACAERILYENINRVLHNTTLTNTRSLFSDEIRDRIKKTLDKILYCESGWDSDPKSANSECIVLFVRFKEILYNSSEVFNILLNNISGDTTYPVSKYLLASLVEDFNSTKIFYILQITSVNDLNQIIKDILNYLDKSIQNCLNDKTGFCHVISENEMLDDKDDNFGLELQLTVSKIFEKIIMFRLTQIYNSCLSNIDLVSKSVITSEVFESDMKDNLDSLSYYTHLLLISSETNMNTVIACININEDVDFNKVLKASHVPLTLPFSLVLLELILRKLSESKLIDFNWLHKISSDIGKYGLSFSSFYSTLISRIPNPFSLSRQNSLLSRQNSNADSTPDVHAWPTFDSITKSDEIVLDGENIAIKNSSNSCANVFSNTIYNTEGLCTETGNYFEVEILIDDEPNLAIGFATFGLLITDELPGFFPLSYGYHGFGSGQCNDMNLINNSISLPKWNKGDVIGCGYDIATHGIFYTLNGELLGELFNQIDNAKLVAIVGFGGTEKQQKAIINFGLNPFRYSGIEKIVPYPNNNKIKEDKKEVEPLVKDLSWLNEVDKGIKNIRKFSMHQFVTANFTKKIDDQVVQSDCLRWLDSPLFKSGLVDSNNESFKDQTNTLLMKFITLETPDEECLKLVTIMRRKVFSDRVNANIKTNYAVHATCASLIWHFGLGAEALSLINGKRENPSTQMIEIWETAQKIRNYLDVDDIEKMNLNSSTNVPIGSTNYITLPYPGANISVFDDAVSNIVTRCSALLQTEPVKNNSFLKKSNQKHWKNAVRLAKCNAQEGNMNNISEVVSFISSKKDFQESIDYKLYTKSDEKNNKFHSLGLNIINFVVLGPNPNLLFLIMKSRNEAAKQRAKGFSISNDLLNEEVELEQKVDLLNGLLQSMKNLNIDFDTTHYLDCLSGANNVELINVENSWRIFSQNVIKHCQNWLSDCDTKYLQVSSLYEKREIKSEFDRYKCVYRNGVNIRSGVSVNSTLLRTVYKDDIIEVYPGYTLDNESIRIKLRDGSGWTSLKYRSDDDLFTLLPKNDEIDIIFKTNEISALFVGLTLLIQDFKPCDSSLIKSMGLLGMLVSVSQCNVFSLRSFALTSSEMILFQCCSIDSDLNSDVSTSPRSPRNDKESMDTSEITNIEKSNSMKSLVPGIISLINTQVKRASDSNVDQLTNGLELNIEILGESVDWLIGKEIISDPNCPGFYCSNPNIPVSHTLGFWVWLPVNVSDGTLMVNSEFASDKHDNIAIEPVNTPWSSLIIKLEQGYVVVTVADGENFDGFIIQSSMKVNTECWTNISYVVDIDNKYMRLFINGNIVAEKSLKLELVCQVIDETEVTVIETEHKYSNDMRKYWRLKVPNAYKYVVECDPNSKTEKEFDYLCFYEGVERSKKIGGKTYSGTSFPGINSCPKLEIKMPVFDMYFHSDGSNNDWGFKATITSYALKGDQSKPKTNEILKNPIYFGQVPSYATKTRAALCTICNAYVIKKPLSNDLVSKLPSETFNNLKVKLNEVIFPNINTCSNPSNNTIDRNIYSSITSKNHSFSITIAEIDTNNLGDFSVGVALKASIPNNTPNNIFKFGEDGISWGICGYPSKKVVRYSKGKKDKNLPRLLKVGDKVIISINIVRSTVEFDVVSSNNEVVISKKFGINSGIPASSYVFGVLLSPGQSVSLNKQIDDGNKLLVEPIKPVIYRTIFKGTVNIRESESLDSALVKSVVFGDIIEALPGSTYLSADNAHRIQLYDKSGWCSIIVNSLAAFQEISTKVTCKNGHELNLCSRTDGYSCDSRNCIASESLSNISRWR
jgi:hypothetical protein